MVYPRKDAVFEMMHYDLDLYKIVDILDDPEAFDCERGRRAKGIVVRCLKRGKKVIKIVLEETELPLGDEIYPAWRIRHVGVIGR